MKSIKTKLIVIISTICIVMGAILGGFSIYEASKTITSNTTEEMKVIAAQAKNTVEASLDAEFSYLEGIASNAFVYSGDSDRASQKHFLQGLAKEHGVTDMGVIDAQGNTLAADGVTMANLAERDYFKKAIKGERAASEALENSTIKGTMIMTFAVPVYDKDNITGVLFMVCDGNYLSNITNKITFGKTGGAYMIKGDGTNIAHQDSSMVLNQTNAVVESANDPSCAKFIQTLKTIIADGNGYSVYEYRGVKKCVGYDEIDGFDWHVIAFASYDELYAGVSKVREGIILLTVIAVIIFSAVGFLVAI